MQRKRNLNKAKLNSEADRLQHLLLTSLSKEKVIQQALGTDLANLLTSPKKKTKPSEIEKEDIYKLPPIPEESVGKSIESSDNSFDEKSFRNYYNINLNSIDVTSKRFQDLPADVRHDILTDLKEKRKESSWGRLHELPAQSDDFSSFQMKRLLKRRQVQVSLESAEKEMGGKCLSLAEMEAMLTDEGILNEATNNAAKAIASNENALYLHVKSLKDAMQEEKKREEKEKEEMEKNELNEVKNDFGMENDFGNLAESLEDEDEDLQTAIQLSLMDSTSRDDQASSSSNGVKLRPEQKKLLRHAVKDSAKAYMIEYGGFNADEVKELVLSDEDNDTINATFRHNDTFILKGDVEVTSTMQISSAIQIDDTNSDVSSDADSDLIEVPDMETDMNLSLREVFPLEMNKEPDADLSKDFRHEDLKQNGLQIEIKKIEFLEDDLFADVFNVKTDDKEEKKSEVILLDSDDEPDLLSKAKIENVKPVNAPFVLSNILENLNAEISDIPTLKLDSLPAIKVATETISIAPISDMSTKNLGLDSILNNLNSEMSDILEKGIDVIKERLSTPPKSPTKNKEGEAVADSGIFKTPKKSTEKDQLPPKVVSPFFRKKTPSPQKRKSFNENEDEISPKIARTLFPSTSSDIEPLQLAASILRENKTTDELKSMAAEVRVQKNDLEFERNRQDRFGVNITERMSADCKHLLRLFGVPYMVAPMEAESQCAYLNQTKVTDGTITDDSDIWLFGGNTVYKHFFNQQKNVLEFQAENIQKLYNLDRHKLIQLSILVGNDYTNGIQGIGAVTAMEILSEFSSKGVEQDQMNEEMTLHSGLYKFREWFHHDKNNFTRRTLRSKLKNITITEDFPSRRVIEALLQPAVDKSDEKFTWGQPDAESIRELAKTTFGWTYSKTDDILLPVLKRLENKKSQQSIKNYFKITSSSSAVAEGSLMVSKRVRRAIDIMSNKCNPEDNEKPVKEKRSRKAVPKDEKKAANSSETEKTTKRTTKPKNPRPKKDEIEKQKIVKLPGEGDDVIPQREVTNAEMDQNKQIAIELFKNTKKNQKK